MKRFARLFRFRWTVLALVLLGALAAGIIAGLLRTGKPAPVLVLREPFRMPVTARNWFEQWLPSSPGWDWAWRVERAMFGRRKPLTVSAEIVSLSEVLDTELSRFSPALPGFSGTNGLQVWFLGADQLKALRERLRKSRGVETLHRPRLGIADGIEGRLFVGEPVPLGGVTNMVGLMFGCFPQVHSHCTDIIAYMNYSELVTNQPIAGSGASSAPVVGIRTNLDMAVRLQVPKGSGAFLVQRGSRAAGHRRMGVLIEPL